MPTIGFNQALGITEHECDICGVLIPWSESNIFGECKECAKEIDGAEGHQSTE